MIEGKAQNIKPKKETKEIVFYSGGRKEVKRQKKRESG